MRTLIIFFSLTMAVLYGHADNVDDLGKAGPLQGKRWATSEHAMQTLLDFLLRLPKYTSEGNAGPHAGKRRPSSEHDVQPLVDFLSRQTKQAELEMPEEVVQNYFAEENMPQSLMRFLGKETNGPSKQGQNDIWKRTDSNLDKLANGGPRPGKRWLSSGMGTFIDLLLRQPTSQNVDELAKASPLKRWRPSDHHVDFPPRQPIQIGHEVPEDVQRSSAPEDSNLYKAKASALPGKRWSPSERDVRALGDFLRRQPKQTNWQDRPEEFLYAIYKKLNEDGDHSQYSSALEDGTEERPESSDG